ncbi:hypothetical protein [Nocardioides euryhalodurans]|uniref:Uncharacterized protein n=1 Tax=Nocardioides euryhalodurans TaxID=2518370 RepID=A0A4P7GHF8_9ACTN|nr:hypothetical protein [Nocardioides euryhalodurans]QBR91107.1 hypothetical protein EXE57_01600 [Nocardioides euryhalodurans]
MRLVTHARAYLAALLMVMVGLVAVASPASAHTPVVEGEVVCDTETGLFDVVWTIGNSERDKVMTYTSRLGDGTVEPNPATVTLTESGLQAGSHSLQVDASWPNGVTASDTATVVAEGECAKPEPEKVTVNPSFTDNVCVDNTYTEPGLDAPEVEGTTVRVDGTVAPGETVTVTYTALEGYVIEGQSVFEHTFPTEPASVEDCADRPEQPEPVVDQRSEVREDCVRVERRTWDIVTGYVWDGEQWVLGEPEVRNDTGWVTVRRLTVAERVAKGCIEIEGEEEVPENPAPPTTPTTPTGSQTPGTPAVPTAVDAGI